MTVTEIRNPYALTDLWEGREIGDPFLMRFDGRFDLYCSSHSRTPGIKCWTSEDMIHFEYRGFVCTDPRTTGAYAPEVVYNAGKFWMVTSPRGSGHYLMKSDSPLGPFEVFSENLGIGIDGSIFIDDDGSSWFYRASHQGIRVHKMPTADEIDVRSEAIPASYLYHWTEGPQVIKRDGRYFLTDTGNHVCSRGYHVDYCVSHEGPDRGYRKLRDGMLLIEIRDEYHALGHSSTCIGPDMDTAYIIYHKNILNEYNHPLYRSMCIDRLFFNGDRMYCNATWWKQPAPVQPVCACRNGEGMVACPEGLKLPLCPGETYTAEINVKLTDDRGDVFFSGDVLTIGKDRRWKLRSGSSGILPQNVDASALITVKVSVRGGRMLLYANGMKFYEKNGVETTGAVGIGKGCAPSFVGFSCVAQGSRECETVKSVPGAFDAVHGIGAAGKTAEGETGCSAIALKGGESVEYPVNVWQSRAYHLAMTVRATSEDITLKVNGTSFKAPATGKATEDGMEKRYFGIINLKEGYGRLTLQAEQDVVIDRIFLTEADEFAPLTVVEDGNDVSGGLLGVTGFKAAASMHRKFCGFTAAEGYGEAWIGGMWRDYEMSMVINWKPCSPEACIAAYLRVDRQSWHPDQVSASRKAYAVRIDEKTMKLIKQEYNETVLAEIPFHAQWGSKVKLLFRVQGSRISVLAEDGSTVLMEALDPMPLVCGHAGISAVTDGLGYDSLIIRRIE